MPVANGNCAHQNVVIVALWRQRRWAETYKLATGYLCAFIKGVHRSTTVVIEEDKPSKAAPFSVGNFSAEPLPPKNLSLAT
jgi:hypothetical protein